MELKPIVRCGYRNCNKVLIDMKPNAKYCSRLHKDYEKTYNKRDLKDLKAQKAQINQMIQQVESLNSLKDSGVLILFNLINGK